VLKNDFIREKGMEGLGMPRRYAFAAFARRKSRGPLNEQTGNVTYRFA